MMRLTRLVSCSLALAGIAALSGCAINSPAPSESMPSARVGDNCTVFFRRDALGMAADSPSPAMSGNHNGADTQVSGKLIRMNAEWLVISDGKRELSIPKDVILVV